MRREEMIDTILEGYLKNGSDKKTLLEIKGKLDKIIKTGKDKTPIDMIFPIIREIASASEEYLDTKNLKDLDVIHGLSTSIYIKGKEACGDFSILLYGGKTNMNGIDITPNTLFDIASITKFFTLVLKDKLVELKIINNDEQLKNILDFGSLEDFTLEDLSLLCGEFRTNGKLTDAKTKEEAYEILKTIYLYSNDRTTNKYNDFGAILTAIALTKRWNEVTGTNLTFDELLNVVIFNKYNLNNTMFNPNKDIIVAGNGNLENLVHDPKTRILGGVTGAAGLFTTSMDQVKFAKEVFRGLENCDIDSPISSSNIKKYGTITFPNSTQSNKGHFGLYQKSKEHVKSLCPRDYADGSFTAQGYTGSSMIFDPVNKIHNTIFVSAIKNIEEYKNLPDFKEYITNEKANGFIEAGHTYQDIVTKNSLIINAIKQITDEEKDDDISLELKIR